MHSTDNRPSLPGQYGIPRPWYFPFTKTYWCGEEENTSMSTPLSKKGNAEGTITIIIFTIYCSFCFGRNVQV